MARASTGWRQEDPLKHRARPAGGFSQGIIGGALQSIRSPLNPCEARLKLCAKATCYPGWLECERICVRERVEVLLHCIQKEVFRPWTKAPEICSSPATCRVCEVGFASDVRSNIQRDAAAEQGCVSRLIC